LLGLEQLLIGRQLRDGSQHLLEKDLVEAKGEARGSRRRWDGVRVLSGRGLQLDGLISGLLLLGGLLTEVFEDTASAATTGRELLRLGRKAAPGRGLGASRRA
jgi:hypothetical protein